LKYLASKKVSSSENAIMTTPDDDGEVNMGLLPCIRRSQVLTVLSKDEVANKKGDKCENRDMFMFPA